MKKIALDDLLQNIQSSEANAKEPAEVKDMIANTAIAIAEAAAKSNVVILTDYDADGICSAFITKKMLEAYNPDISVRVECNDRRGSYGVPKYIIPEDGVQYIVQDMGSSELNYIHDTFGKDTIVLDHHIIDNPDFKKQFQVSDLLLNTHCIACEDGLSAEYCATGLAYRVYETLKELHQHGCQNGRIPSFEPDEKLDNTLAIMACIGTVADMMNLADIHSNNRAIVKDGLRRIEGAVVNSLEDANINTLVAQMFYACKLFNMEEDQPLPYPKKEIHVYAKDIGFNIGPFINAPSRMSEFLKANGAQMLFDVLSGDESNMRNHISVGNFADINQYRKDMMKVLFQSPEFRKFIDDQKDTDSNIVLCIAPEGTYHTLCGLLAGRVAEECDKAAIVLTQKKTDDGKVVYGGSGRNASTNATGLKAFLDEVVQIEHIDIKYGGHADALGVSYIDEENAKKLSDAFAKHGHKMKKTALKDTAILDINPLLLDSPEVIQKFLSLEPIGMGVKIPPVLVEGTIRYDPQKDIIKGNPKWVNMKIGIKNPSTGREKLLYIKNWNYNPEDFPVDKNGKIKFLANPEIDTFGGNIKLALTPVKNIEFDKERQKEIEALSKEDSSMQK